MTGNVALTGTIVVPDKATLNLTMSESVSWGSNGKDHIVMHVSSDFSATSMIKVEYGGTLNITGHSYSNYFGIRGSNSGNLSCTRDADGYLTDLSIPEGKTWPSMSNGAINSCGTVNLNNVRIYDMYAPRGGGAIYIPYGGYKHGKTTVKNSWIHRCKSGRGPALMVESQIEYDNTTGSVINGADNTASSCEILFENVQIKDCYVTNFDSGPSGVVRTYGNCVGNIIFKSVTFTTNTTLGNGAAIFWNGHGRNNTKMVFDGCRIYKNYAYGDGGAASLEGSFEFVNNLTEIYSNKAGGKGGAITIKSYNSNNKQGVSNLEMNFNEWVSIYGNSAAGDGGGIAVTLSQTSLPEGSSVSLKLDGVNVSSNNSGQNGGGLYMHNNVPLSNGVALSLTLAGDTVLDNNTATGNGGGVYCETNSGTQAPSISFTGGNISNNGATRGAGAYILRSSIMCERSEGEELKFYKNEATNNGGGIYIQDGTLTMSGGILDSNRCNGCGGGLYSYDSQVEILGGNFESNWAALAEENLKNDGINGGAIYVQVKNADQEGTHSLVLEGGKFKYNKADRGGAIYVSKANILMDKLNNTELLFEDNYSDNTGGAIAIYDGSSMTVNEGRFINNVSDNTAGAIHLNTAGGKVVLNGGHFEGNKAVSNGGVINMTNGTCTINGGTYINNSCRSTKANQGKGGALYFSGVTCEISGGTFSSNTSSHYGGAIYLTGVECTVNGGVFENNQSDYGGGALALRETDSAEGTLIIKGGTIRNNKVGVAANDGSISVLGYGGGVCVVGGSCSILKGDASGDGAVITTNHALGYGGGIYVNNESSAKTLEVSGGSISENTAVRGGGLYVVATQMVVSDGRIIGNKAINGGGMFVTGGADMTFGDGLIAENKALVNLPGEDSNTVTTTTAYNTAASLYGVGGGVFLGSGSDAQSTTLTFNGTGDFGLYNNQAEVAADDIYSYGVNTSITLPNISQMSLKGYQTKTSELYWVEDYMTNDSAYPNLTATAPSGYMAMRYRDAVAAQTTVYKQVSTRAITGYLCLSLGHEIIYISIMRKGLLKGENAVYNIYRYDDKWVHYSSVILSGPEDAVNQDLANQKSSSKRFAVYSGEWRIEEAPWAWSYTAFNAIERIITGVSSEAEKTFIFSAEKQPSSEEGYVAPNAYSESMVANDYGSGVVTKDKGAPESNSSYEIIQDNEIKW